MANKEGEKEHRNRSHAGMWIENTKEGNMVFVIRKLGPDGDKVTRKTETTVQVRDVLSPKFATFVNGILCHTFTEVLEAAQSAVKTQEAITSVVAPVQVQEPEVLVEMLAPIAGG